MLTYYRIGKGKVHARVSDESLCAARRRWWDGLTVADLEYVKPADLRANPCAACLHKLRKLQSELNEVLHATD